MSSVAWVEGSKQAHCINKENLECGGVLDLPRALVENEPFISTNQEKREAHSAEGWVECPNECGFAIWVKPA